MWPSIFAQQELERKQISPPVLKLKELPIALLCEHQQLPVAAKSDTNLSLGTALSAQGSLFPPCLQALQPLTVCSFLLNHLIAKVSNKSILWSTQGTFIPLFNGLNISLLTAPEHDLGIPSQSSIYFSYNRACVLWFPQELQFLHLGTQSCPKHQAQRKISTVE